MYEISPRVDRQIRQSFTYHPPRPDQVPRYTELRDRTGELATRYAELAPESRELSLALTHLETAVMFVNAAIARNEGGEGADG